MRRAWQGLPLRKKREALGRKEIEGPIKREAFFERRGEGELVNNDGTTEKGGGAACRVAGGKDDGTTNEGGGAAVSDNDRPSEKYCCFSMK